VWGSVLRFFLGIKGEMMKAPVSRPAETETIASSDKSASVHPHHYPDDRDVLVRIKATPEGLRNLAAMLETREVGQSVRVNWYTVQVEFVRHDGACAMP
jgi:hypothetical protein